MTTRNMRKATSHSLTTLLLCCSWLSTLAAVRLQPSSKTRLTRMSEEPLSGDRIKDGLWTDKFNAKVDNTGFFRNDQSNAQIKYYFVFGLRWSGVRYVEKILEKAFSEQEVPSLWPLSNICFPNKHSNDLGEEAHSDVSQAATEIAASQWYPWKYEPFSRKEFRGHLSSSIIENCRRIRRSFEGSNNADATFNNVPSAVSAPETLDIDDIMRQTLFIMVVKDPYAWLSSVVRQKYRMAAHGNKLVKIHTAAVVESSHQELRHLLDENRLPLDILVKNSYEKENNEESTKDNGQKAEGKTNLGKKRYRTLMSKRSFTLQKQYSALQKMKHSAVLRYEDVLANPEIAFKTVFRGLDGLSLPKNLTFEPLPYSLKQVPSSSGYGQFDVVNAPFERRDFYLEKKYLRYLDDRTMKRVNNDINKALERKVGNYIIPPTEFKWQSAILRRKNKSQKSKSLLHSFFSFVMSVLTGLTVVTCVILAGLFTLTWLRGYSESEQSKSSGHLNKISNPYTNSSKARVRKKPDPKETAKAKVSKSTGKDRSPHLMKDEWVEAFDTTSGHVYYFNTLTEEAQWEHPYMAKNINDEYSDKHLDEEDISDGLMSANLSQLPDEEISLSTEFARLQRKGRKEKGDIAQDDPIAAPHWEP